jgi:hypothetical protein
MKMLAKIQDDAMEFVEFRNQIRKKNTINIAKLIISINGEICNYIHDGGMTCECCFEDVDTDNKIGELVIYDSYEPLYFCEWCINKIHKVKTRILTSEATLSLMIHQLPIIADIRTVISAHYSALICDDYQ